MLDTEQQQAADTWAKYEGYDSWEQMAEKQSLEDSDFEDAYQGLYESTGEFAETLVTIDLGEVDPQSSIYSYINWEDFWHGELRHDYFEVPAEDHGTYIFRAV